MISKTYLLLVDDEPEVLATYTQLLRNQKYGVKEFISSSEALAFLRFTDKQFELVISDLNMPEINGIEFLKKVREIPRYVHTPFIFLSAVQQTEFQLQAYKYGAIDFIQKPISNALFLSKIKSILISYRTHTLMNNIIDRGNENKLSVEQIIGLCEDERITGFAILFKKNAQAIITFEKGVLKDVTSGILSGPAAFEDMSTWKKYKYFLVRGSYSQELGELIKKQI